MRELHESIAEDYYIEMDGVQGDRKLIELADGAVAAKVTAGYRALVDDAMTRRRS